MRLTPLGFRVITIAPLAPAAVILWAVLAALPFFNGLSLLGLFVIAALVATSNFIFANYRHDYGHVARHSAA